MGGKEVNNIKLKDTKQYRISGPLRTCFQLKQKQRESYPGLGSFLLLCFPFHFSSGEGSERITNSKSSLLISAEIKKFSVLSHDNFCLAIAVSMESACASLIFLLLDSESFKENSF